MSKKQATAGQHLRFVSAFFLAFVTVAGIGCESSGHDDHEEEPQPALSSDGDYSSGSTNNQPSTNPGGSVTDADSSSDAGTDTVDSYPLSISPSSMTVHYQGSMIDFNFDPPRFRISVDHPNPSSTYTWETSDTRHTGVFPKTGSNVLIEYIIVDGRFNCPETTVTCTETQSDGSTRTAQCQITFAEQ